MPVVGQLEELASVCGPIISKEDARKMQTELNSEKGKGGMKKVSPGCAGIYVPSCALPYTL